MEVMTYKGFEKFFEQSCDSVLLKVRYNTELTSQDEWILSYIESIKLDESNKKAYIERAFGEFQKQQERLIQVEKKEKFSKHIYELLLSKMRDTATEEIVMAILERNRIYTTRNDENSEMWIYKEGIYIPEGKTFIKEFCRDVLGDVFTTTFCNLVIDKIQADTYIDQTEFFENKYVDLIATQNGILNVKTKQFMSFNPKYIFFNKINSHFNPELTCENTIQFFKEVLASEEDVLVMQELFGYCLYKDKFLEKAFMFTGSGRNGKSKALELLKLFLVPNNIVSLPLQKLEKDRFCVSGLMNKLANIAGDISGDDLKETGVFKSIVGRDMQTADRKFKTMVNFDCYAALIFSANKLPRTYDTTPAFWNRWVLLEFPFSFLPQDELDKLSEKDKQKAKLQNTERISGLISEEEMSGILNWALEGLARLFEHKSFSSTKGSDGVKKLWIRKSDSFAAYCMDCLKEDQDTKIVKQTLRLDYSRYCREHKLVAASDKAIKVTLENEYYCWEDRWRDGDVDQQYWGGIRFIKEKDGFGFGKDGEGFSTPIGKKNSIVDLKTPKTLTENI